jgi:hypothetical protein
MFCLFLLILDSSALWLYGNRLVKIGSGGKYSSNFNLKNVLNIGENSIFEVEVNLSDKKVHYFLNKVQCPVSVYGISSPLLFGVNAFDSNAILEVIFVRKLTKSFVDSSIECERIRWR